MAKNTQYGKRNHTAAVHLCAVAVALTVGVTALSQTVFARTYVIRDGERVVTYTTFATDPAQVLGQAGVNLTEYDSYTTEAVDGTEEITIRRAHSVTVRYHGEETTVTAFGETAGELLNRLNLELGDSDVVSHALETPTFDGMELCVDRIQTVRETYTVSVPYETIHCNDAATPEGTQAVLVEGVEGQLLCTAEVTYLNGLETGRDILEESVVVAPVTQIIAVGTGEKAQAVDPDAMPVIADGYITLPTGEVLTYTDTATIRATAYTHTDAGCDMTTSTGTTVHWGTVAVDPRYIPYGTRMFIVSNDGAYVYGIAVAEDCGGDIKGDRMDLYMPTYQQCIQFGRRVCTIYFLG